jgi:hypothetical protein
MTLQKVLSWPFLALIRIYQLTLSPLLGARCKYHPSCSRYGYAAIERFGPLLGIWMAGYRILRCNPFARGGLDPVPPVGTPWQDLVLRPHKVEQPAASVDKTVDNSPGIAPAA